MPEQSNDYRVVLYGAAGVGKSSLVVRFLRGTYRDGYVPTVEDTYLQVINCNGQICTLQITDTAGGHQFPAMQRLSISKGHAFILVYSVTSRQSLEELRSIFKEIRDIKGVDMENVPIMLVGNKCDDTLSREVSTQEATALATAWKTGYTETSARSNHNVQELFRDLLQMEKRRTMSLELDTKKQSSAVGDKCALM